MSEPARLLPPLALAVSIACVAGAGALATCSLLAALLKTPTNGLLSLIIQLVIADAILLATTIGPELWSFNEKTWTFGKECCAAYRGLNVFASTASSYLILTIALHTLATVNLEEKILTRSKRNDQDEDEEIRSSRHSLVANSDSSTPPRTMNVDYRLVNTTVPVTQPTIFIWVLSASLSVPEFTLATIVNLNEGVVLCTMIDSSHRLYMYSMLTLFNFLLPTVMMIAAGALVVTKLASKKLLGHLDVSEAAPALKLSLWLIVSYIVMCAPQSLARVYRFYTSLDKYVTYSIENETQTLALSCAYLMASLLRPIMCIILLPRIRSIFSFNSRFISEDV